MKFSNKGNNGPNVKPVIKIELSEKNFTLRAVLAALLLGIGLAALMFALTALLSTDPGWYEVEVSSTEPNCSADFILNYYFGDDGASASVQRNQLTTLYTQATEDAYRIFSRDVAGELLYNVYYVNTHVNQEIEVDPALYGAFEAVKAHGNRSLYLAPVYVEYNRMFLSENEQEASAYDPGQNQDLAEYVRELASFARDPEMIDLELLGNNRIRLYVSEAYLEFAAAYEIDAFLDFGWMKNAFIIDYLAQVLVEKGYTSGYLASYDGFTRNLDTRGESYSFNIYDRQENSINLPAVMSYQEPTSIVFLRNYPMSDLDRWHYYSFQTGRIATAFVDAADGMSKSATDNLVSYSNTSGCAEILMQMIPVFIAEELSVDALDTMASGGVYSIWAEGSILCYNDAGIQLEILPDGAALQYTKALYE